MPFIAVVITYLVLRWKGSADFLHKDDWFYRWCEYLARLPALSNKPVAVLVLALAGPVLALLVLLALVDNIWHWLQLLVAVVVLLYTVGRGRFRRAIKRYRRAREEGDWLTALAAYQTTVAPQELTDDLPEQDDWKSLDERMNRAIAYRGLERTFAVLFWFVLLGPAGALLYRLSTLYRQGEDKELPAQSEAARFLWYLEWPASRVLGLSFALTGNFVSCVHSLREHFWKGDQPTGESLQHFIEGALHVGEQSAPETTARVEPEAMLALLSRTLIFWISVLAVITVLI